MFDLTATPLPADEAAAQLKALLAGEDDPLANAANFVAFLALQLPDINWVGLYRRAGDELVLGPFQGRPACVRIPLGRGVCGTAVARAESQRVADVDAFPGHIACDAASRAELVVPLWHDGEVVGVVDVDSPRRDRFSDADQALVETLAAAYLDSSAPL
ncbi:GAF domain-containing protein [Pseudohaliea rubra]|uniref:Free methionine-(R)-sulfoxide reductase n=1 Tax=Pseudohaliea rubra DSM 19751 TaxID=1265313 RepID=A0A095VR67_9GAMM|nr:GAF domain-containing protein [Pseudohaliea rubra]KGE03875.1 Free methionine-(R)-sulfoxide reductase [Pseudohaliea rubra DSM 19751]